MSVLPWTRVFEKTVRPDPKLPANARELLGDLAGYLSTRGVACYTGRDSLWARLPGGEVRIDATDLPRPMARLAVAPASVPEGDAEFLARQHCEVAAARVRLARQYPLDARGEPAWNPRRTLADVERLACDPDATERDVVLDAAINDEKY